MKRIRVPRLFKLEWDYMVVRSKHNKVGFQVRLRFRPKWDVYILTVLKTGVEFKKREWRGRDGWVDTMTKAVDFK